MHVLKESRDTSCPKMKQMGGAACLTQSGVCGRGHKDFSPSQLPGHLRSFCTSFHHAQERICLQAFNAVPSRQSTHHGESCAAKCCKRRRLRRRPRLGQLSMTLQMPQAVFHSEAHAISSCLRDAHEASSSWHLHVCQIQWLRPNPMVLLMTWKEPKDQMEPKLCCLAGERSFEIKLGLLLAAVVRSSSTAIVP